MSDLRIKSTSRRSAECSDVVLRETETTRLVFRPMLVDNPNDKSASVKGTFIFRRKTKRNSWEDVPRMPLSALKSGEGYKLSLNSVELASLYTELQGLYKLYEREGIPLGQVEYVRATKELQRVASMPQAELRAFLGANRSVGSSLLIRLFSWAIQQDDPEPMIDLLVGLGPDSLRKLNVVVGIQALKSVVDMWNNNRSNSDEEFWQATLTENSFVLEQVFSWPCTVVRDKAYVGGKNVMNRKGRIVDYLVKNRLTENAALVEIKTPSTKLLGSIYRQDLFNVSPDLSGSVLQASNYRHSLGEHYLSLTQGQKDLFHAFNPKCVVLIGDTSQLREANEIKAFELFRSQLSNITVLTFDELFTKIQSLISAFEIATEPDADDCPF